ncbi:hypothetical protein FB451DRAFT_1171935 [Mycena latifolia]|nr:hypothetical protein FB451DRAFT_1171935 [Mycena latifolia]
MVHRVKRRPRHRGKTPRRILLVNPYPPDVEAVEIPPQAQDNAITEQINFLQALQATLRAQRVTREGPRLADSEKRAVYVPAAPTMLHTEIGRPLEPGAPEQELPPEYSA